MTLDNLELYFVEVIRGKRKGVVASALRFVLRLFSWIFRLIIACRNWAFDHGWFRKYYPPVPLVISVGNIVAGGTGKTPVTLMLANEFYDKYALAISTRGYRSHAEKNSVPLLLSEGKGPLHPASYCGDEPFLLSFNLPKAFVFVGRNRSQACAMAAKAGAQIILLDDAMQHRQLARDFEIAVVDATDPFGGGYFLPRGLLREGAHSLERADLVIVNHVHDLEHFAIQKKKLAQFTSSPVIATRMEVDRVLDLQGNFLESIDKKKVGIFCGIAQPGHFHKILKSLDAEVMSQHIVPDHRDFDLEVLKAFASKCADLGAELLVCTEKDQVKLAKNLKLPLTVVWLKAKLCIIEGQEHWTSFIEKAKSTVNK